MQSSLYSRVTERQERVLPVYRYRLIRTLTVYSVVYGVSLLIVALGSDVRTISLGLGLAWPGAGFLAWSEWGLALAFAAFLVFCSTLFIWFAVGAAIAPPAAWIAMMFVAALGAPQHPVQDLSTKVVFVLTMPPILVVLVYLLSMRCYSNKKSDDIAIFQRPRSRKATHVASISEPPQTELAETDLRLLRLFLDRALQPVDAFNGFEILDQFQTAAVRYQVSFLSYALSMTSAEFLPALKGPMVAAQTRLKEKQGDPLNWRYWGLENAWGNLRFDADPIARDNIMYSGFVGAQLAYAQRSLDLEDIGPLCCRSAHHKGPTYNLSDIVDALARQYKSAPFGLLPCEPNWIYPLCNLLTLTGVRAFSEETWGLIEPTARAGLETEFTNPDGALVPFRSSYTGIAAPTIGGAVMQAFPCFFMNALWPDLAEKHWERVQQQAAQQGWRRILWPVDVGNYGFSRASSYAATALAARELGDNESADELIERFLYECPAIEENGAVHHEQASLWAHANYFMARIGRKDMLRALVTNKSKRRGIEPHIAEAAYPEVLVSKAVCDDGRLDMVLSPGGAPGFQEVKIGGLAPATPYAADGLDDVVVADENGEAVLQLFLDERISVSIGLMT